MAKENLDRRTNGTDILLVYPPWDVKFYQAPGLPILAAHILEKNHTVRILDAVANDYTFDQTIEEIEKINPGIIGVSVPFTAMVKNAVDLLKRCKEKFKNKLILTGGYHSTIRPQDVADYCDLVVLGDGGITVNEIIEKYKSDKNIYGVKGTAYKKKSEIFFNPLRSELGTLLTPAWHLYPTEQHKLTLYLATKERAFPLQTGRGCPFNCTFCCNSKNYEKVQYREMQEVMDEIKYVIKKFNVRAFHIWDETFTLKKDRVKDFCERVMKDNLNIRWSCQTRAGLLNEEIIDLLKKAGCVRISLGVESGDPYVLKTIRKGIKLEHVERDIKAMKKIGITSYAGFMLGHAEETPDSLARTIEFMDKLDPDFIGFRIAIPYPGCVFRDQAEKSGGIVTNDLSKYREDHVVYVPPALKGYDLGKIRDLGYAYFYLKNKERLSRIKMEGFNELIEKISHHNSVVREGLPVGELIEKYCKNKN